MSSESILVTGGAGFIGSNFVLEWAAAALGRLVNLDKLTYAGNLRNLESLEANPSHIFVRGDIADVELVSGLLEQHQPRAIVHFAAESHVDRSIHGPEDFIATNVIGTFRLLEAARTYWSRMSAARKNGFASCISLPTRCSAHCNRRIHRLPKTAATRLTAPTRRQKLLPITW